MCRVRRAAPLLLLSLSLSPAAASAQGTITDYQRAMGLREAWQTLAVGVPDTVRSNAGSNAWDLPSDTHTTMPR